MKYVNVLTLASAILSVYSYASDPRSTGDVVGRDLNVWGAGGLGHVGIWDGSRVLEVLDKSPVIQKNSLSNFKNESSSYWGAKYGKGYSHYRIVSNGWKQRDYNPEYTITALYREGKWGYENGRYTKIRAKFRCDTFVNYAYKSVTNSNLVTFFTPRNLYKSFPSSR